MPLKLTYGLMLFCFSSVNAARVVLSLYALNLGAHASAVGVLVATFFVFPLLLSWPLGVLSDRLGSRWLLLLGTLCGACGMLVPYFVRELPALYIAGTMIGLSFAFYNVLLPNLVGLLSESKERAQNFSNASMIGSATTFIGPLTAGLAIDQWGHATACLCIVGLALTAAALLLLWGNRLPGSTRRVASAGSIRDIVRDPGMLRILATSSMLQLGYDLFQFYLPVYGHGIGLSASAIGAVLASFAVATFIVRFVMPRLISKFGEESLLAYSFFIAAAGLALVPFFESAPALGVISFIFGLGMGGGFPITTILIFSRSAKGRSGEAVGARQTAGNIARVTAPPVFGLIVSTFGLLAVFCLTALMLAAGGVLSRPSGSNRDRTPPVT